MAIKINNNTIINDNRGIVDINNNVGIAKSVLTSNGTAIEWRFVGDVGASSKGFTLFAAHTF
jgi:hypothetical protein